jgi:hypothetical protein
MEDGLFAALLQLRDAADGNTTVFAELFPNVRALAGVMDLLGPQLEGNIELMRDHASAAGVASEAFSVFAESSQADVDRLAAQQERLAILQGSIRSVSVLLSVRTGRCERRRVRTGSRSQGTCRG